MKGKGFVKLYRDVMFHTVFSDPYLYKLFNYCLIKASHQKRDYLMDNNIIELEAGEFIWGRKVATEELNYKAPPKYKLSEKSWENKLKVLEKMQIVTRKTTNKYTVVKVVNWGVYQSKEQESYQQDDHQITINVPTDYQQIATDKNLKELERKSKNDKEVVVYEEINDNNDTQFSSLLKTYSENIESNPPPITVNTLKKHYKEYGNEILDYAIEKSTLAGSKDYRFINHLLKDWKENSLTGIEAIKDYENSRGNKKHKGPSKALEEYKPYANAHDSSYGVVPKWLQDEIDEENKNKPKEDEPDDEYSLKAKELETAKSRGSIEEVERLEEELNNLLPF